MGLYLKTKDGVEVPVDSIDSDGEVYNSEEVYSESFAEFTELEKSSLEDENKELGAEVERLDNENRELRDEIENLKPNQKTP